MDQNSKPVSGVVDGRVSPYILPDGTVRTAFNNHDKPKYDCHGAAECSASWTWDDWHCTGCHWKGMGCSDLKFGDDALRAKAESLRQKLADNVKLAGDRPEKRQIEPASQNGRAPQNFSGRASG